MGLFLYKIYGYKSNAPPYICSRNVHLFLFCSESHDTCWEEWFWLGSEWEMSSLWITHPVPPSFIPIYFFYDAELVLHMHVNRCLQMKQKIEHIFFYIFFLSLSFA